SDREQLLDFVAAGPAIAKALSGSRGDCRVVTGADFESFDERSGPVHVQRLVEGDDVRAHVIGEEVVAVRIHSRADAYRLDTEAESEPWELPPDLAACLRAATRAFGLSFAGWDLRLDGDRYWVFEANPMPGYDFYDQDLDGRITDALICHLLEG